MAQMITEDLVRLDADLGTDKHDVIRALARIVDDAGRATDAAQLAVGCAVTSHATIRLRPSSMTTNPSNALKVAVGTRKKSQARISPAWFRRNARHEPDGDPE